MEDNSTKKGMPRKEEWEAGMDNSCEIYAFQRLIKRYDYDGAIELLELLQWQGTVLYNIVLSCQRSLNFNFHAAKELTDQIPEQKIEAFPGFTRHIQELPLLIKGAPHEIFNELIDNLVIQLEREAYTDFLGRIFQVRELLFKYAVIQFKIRQEYPLRDRIYQKSAFEQRFKMNHGLMNGMKEILRTGGGRWQKIVNVLSGKQMGELMDLRHRTIVAHGIETATLRDIERIYESADHVMDDLLQVFQWLNIPIRDHKFKLINLDINQWIEKRPDSST